MAQSNLIERFKLENEYKNTSFYVSGWHSLKNVSFREQPGYITASSIHSDENGTIKFDRTVQIRKRVAHIYYHSREDGILAQLIQVLCE